MNRLRLSDIYTFSSVVTGTSPFRYINSNQQLSPVLTWLTVSIASYLDEKLILEHSGDKYISPYIERLLKLKESGTIQDINPVLCVNIVNTYKDKWNKIYDALIDSDYNPLENYDMTQVETPNIIKDKSSSFSSSKTETSSRSGTRNDSSTENEDNNSKIKTTSKGDSSTDVYGFNSVNPSPSSENDANTEVVVEGDKNDNYKTITRSGNNTESESHNSTDTVSDTGHDVETETGTRGLTRHGNIGVTTSQQMLESEIELRNKNNFYKMVLNDVSSILCLSVY